MEKKSNFLKFTKKSVAKTWCPRVQSPNLHHAASADSNAPLKCIALYSFQSTVTSVTHLSAPQHPYKIGWEDIIFPIFQMKN